jgi:hypothetical protein
MHNWIDERVENISEEEAVSRRQRIIAENALDAAVDKIEQWNKEDGVDADSYREERAFILAKPADQRTDDDERNLDSLERLSMEYETDIADGRASLAWARKLAKEATKADKDLRKSKKKEI